MRSLSVELHFICAIYLNIFLLSSYSEVVNVFGRRTVDTQREPSKKNEILATIPETSERIFELSGHPIEHVEGRTAKIYIQAKNSMQSGTYSLRKWKIEFDNRERWENPTMGWGSTGDPLSNLQPEFGTKEDAIIYCQRMG